MNKNNIKNQAIIFAGGKGMRLRPFTKIIPKPLLPIGDYSSLQIILKQLKKFQFDEVFLCVGYKADLIKSFFGSGETIGIKINYIIEKNPRGTVGGLKLINSLKNNFLVINGDIITNLNFNILLKDHIKKKNLITAVTKRVNIKSKYGVIYKNNNNLIFKEKPIIYSNILAGIYVMQKEIINLIPKNKYFGIDSLIKKLLRNRMNINIFDFHGFWSDIGNEEDYNNINRIFSNKSIIKKLKI